MANTNRRIIDRSGNMFLPMNMEGNNYTDSFWQTPKLVVTAAMLFALVIILIQPAVGGVPIGQMFRLLLIWLVQAFFIFRYIIFEEKFNYKMYKQMLKYEIQTPAIFWDIVQIKNTGDGQILTYRDGKTAVMVKVDRDTITGKPREFKERHFDAIQDFYNRLQNYRLSFVQMNVMEPAGNDPRLVELDKLITKNDNPNIQKLMQLEVGYTKKKTKKTLYESDIFLIYVKDRTRVDTIIADVEDCIFELLNGAYIGYRLMDEADILDFIKDQYGVSYFNRTEATLSLFSRTNQTMKPTFTLYKVTDTSGREYEISKASAMKIHNMAIQNEQGAYDMQKINIKKDVISKDPKYQNLVTFDDLLKKPETAKKNQVDEEQRFRSRKDIQAKGSRKGDAVLGTNVPDRSLDGLKANQANTKKQPKHTMNIKKIMKPDETANTAYQDEDLNFDDSEIDLDSDFGDSSDVSWDTIDNKSAEDENLDF